MKKNEKGKNDRILTWKKETKKDMNGNEKKNTKKEKYRR
jgi:hypothetical protein